MTDDELREEYKRVLVIKKLTSWDLKRDRGWLIKQINHFQNLQQQ